MSIWPIKKTTIPSPSVVAALPRTTAPAPVPAPSLAFAPASGLQEDAAVALVGLVREDAPRADWFVPTNRTGLHGHLPEDTDPRAQRHGIAAWQRVIGAGPVTTTKTTDGERLTVVGRYEGVDVHVSTTIPNPVKETPDE